MLKRGENASGGGGITYIGKKSPTRYDQAATVITLADVGRYIVPFCSANVDNALRAETSDVTITLLDSFTQTAGSTTLRGKLFEVVTTAPNQKIVGNHNSYMNGCFILK